MKNLHSCNFTDRAFSWLMILRENQKKFLTILFKHF